MKKIIDIGSGIALAVMLFALLYAYLLVSAPYGSYESDYQYPQSNE